MGIMHGWERRRAPAGGAGSDGSPGAGGTQCERSVATRCVEMLATGGTANCLRISSGNGASFAFVASSRAAASSASRAGPNAAFCAARRSASALAMAAPSAWLGRPTTTARGASTMNRFASATQKAAGSCRGGGGGGGGDQISRSSGGGKSGTGVCCVAPSPCGRSAPARPWPPPGRPRARPRAESPR